MRRRQLVIIGTGGLGRETLWALNEGGDGDARYEVIGFLTNAAEEHGSEVCGLPVLGGERWVVGRPDVHAVCCIGDPRGRRELALSLAGSDVSFASVVHPSALMSEHVKLGVGCVVGARAVLTSQVKVGDHVVIGVGAIISHDSEIEDYATLAPGVLLAGCTRVGYGAELGANATVIPGRCVGRGARVGAQSAVIEDVEPNVVAAGVPARKLSEFPPERRL